MKIQSYLFTLFTLVSLHACKFDTTSTSLGLSVKDSYFARVNEEGYLVKEEKGIFKKGENVNLTLVQVSGFKKGADGLNSFEMEMEVYDMEGKLILSMGNLLGDNGHINLENNVAELPYASLTNTQYLDSGQYKFTLVIYDNIGKGKASQTRTFTLE